MSLEMFGQLLDTLAQQRNLHFGRTGVLGVGVILGDDTQFGFFAQWHSLGSDSFSASISL
jgi:hypothetical protein